METRLKSILRQIHWSLALKAVVLAAVWFLLPGWFFLVLGFYFYFVPVFHPWKLFLPFLVFLFLAFSSPSNFGFAIIIALLFYVVMGIKDLIFIDRRSAYNSLILVFVFLLDIWFFAELGDSDAYLAPLSTLLLGGVLCWLYGGFLFYSNPEWRLGGGGKAAGLSLGLAWIILSQIYFAVLFLPLNFLYQSALAFFLSAALFDLVSVHLGGIATRQRILVSFSATFVFLVMALGSASWGI